MSITVTAIVSVTITVGCHSLCQSRCPAHCIVTVTITVSVPVIFTVYSAKNYAHIQSTFHHIKYNELVLNAFPKRNVLSCFLKEARLLQDLIGNGNEFQKLGAVLAKARFLSVG